ncbi:MAG: response regulator, partial [Elusimicrobia bacterium]|nr:response regulator [Elusimicrobiota bacterium]
MKILVIDDDEEIHETLNVFLQSLGYESKYALNAREGLKQAVIYEPDVIFLDIRLPDKDGIEILREIRQINKNISVVMIT